MTEPTRRSTRSQSRASTASTSQIAIQFDEEQKQKRSSQKHQKEQKKQLFQELIHKPNLTVKELNDFLGKTPYKTYPYLMHSNEWTEYVKQWIQQDQPGLVHYYIILYSKNHSINRMYDLTDLLNEMRDQNRDYLFYDRVDFWKQYKKSIKEMVYAPETWRKHIEDTFLIEDKQKKEAYIRKLIQHGWRIDFDSITEYISHIDIELLTILAKYMVQSYGEHAYFKASHYGKIKEYLEDTDDPKIDHFISTLIKLTPLNEYPVLFTRPEQNTPAINIYLKRENIEPNVLETIILRCIEANFTQTLDEILNHLNMNHEANKHWISHTFKRYIAYKDDSAEKILREIILGKSIDLNTIFIDIPSALPQMLNVYVGLTIRTEVNMNHLQELTRNAMADPMINPYLWLKSIPLLTYAIIYKNTRAIKFLIMLGVSMDQCGFLLNHLTEDPEIMKLFLAKHHILKIQRKFKEHYYSPKNIRTQRMRNTLWDKHRESFNKILNSPKRSYQKESKPSQVERATI